MWSQQPYMQYVDISTHLFGFIMASGFLFGGMAGFYGHRLRHNLSNRHMIMVLAGGTSALMALATIIPVQPAIIFILMVSGIWGFGFPFVQNAINKYADPAQARNHPVYAWFYDKRDIHSRQFDYGIYG